jgi:hypothetical protein
MFINPAFENNQISKLIISKFGHVLELNQQGGLGTLRIGGGRGAGHFDHWM